MPSHLSAALNAVHAETALAYGLKQDASEWFSQQDFFFCRGLSRGQERSCASNWSLEKALTVLAATPPTTPKCLPYTPFATNRCAYKCPGNAKPHPDVTTGKFWFQNLGQPADAQQWIRQHGPVLTSMKLYKEHLFSFLEKTPGGIYRGPGAREGWREAGRIELCGGSSSVRHAHMLLPHRGPRSVGVGLVLTMTAAGTPRW